MVRAIRRGSAAPSAHTYGASIHAVNQSRGQGLPGGSNNSHRLIRRGLPYGPSYDRTQPYDGLERGMLFQFINANIENQYEFVLRQWVNDSEFAGRRQASPKVEGSTDWHPEPGGEHLRHTAGKWRAADRGDGSVELRYDQGRGLRVSAQRHGHQVHRQPGRSPVIRQHLTHVVDDHEQHAARARVVAASRVLRAMTCRLRPVS